MNLIQTFNGLPAENRSENLRSFVDQVKVLKNCSNLVLAKVLYEIEKNEYYREWVYEDQGAKKTYSSINDFARIAFEYSASTTQAFLRIHQKFSVDLQVPDDKLTSLAWGNLKIVCPHTTSANVERVLKICEGKQKDVREWASQFAEQVSEKPPKYSFTCSKEQAEIFDTALDISREYYAKDTGSPPDTDTVVWEYIAAKFLQIELKPLTLNDSLLLLERRFDVKLGIREDDAPIPVREKRTGNNSQVLENLQDLGLSLAEEITYDELPEVLSVEDFR